jgi:hypothetical protein
MLKKILFTAAALSLSTAALAHDDHGRGRGWGHERHFHHFAPRPVVVVPAPRVVYAPPPRVVYPYYAAPVAAPVVVRPAPVYSEPGVSIRFDIPL